MRHAEPKAIQLADYRPPDYWIDQTELHFALAPTGTRVTATLQLRRNTAVNPDGKAPLVLDGQELRLLEITLDERALAAADYQVDDDTLTLPGPLPERFTLRTVTEIDPVNNTALEGLYQSRGLFCTQCEAEGFRKITYYLDRPDVLSEFRTTLVADPEACPVLLSNGNEAETGRTDDGRHFATWHDPHPKPSYLFALVAGDLDHIEDRFTTASGRDVRLRIYVEAKDLDKCDHAMASLKNAMRWDEEQYGREYDLDQFNIVAVDDFNMGAMENKGLNIFNTSCVLAHPDTTTDAGFQRVEGVVAHEYFHNWSGNRVTCRDWFQLSLKEGFTVFRDSQFSADMGSPTVKRVEDVNILRTHQFAEDAGPLAHPVRPDSYIEISNFYTLTIYEKGAEVVRMLYHLLGPEQFRAGSDLYFSRHDGEAATVEDFVAAMAEVSGENLDRFMRWYRQAGTPVVSGEGEYDPQQRRFTLTLRQHTPATPGQPDKEPLVIPVAMGLVGPGGAQPLHGPAVAQTGADAGATHAVLTLEQAEQQFVFEQLDSAPVPALLRGFSAPVKLRYPYSRDDLVTLLAGDDDGFVRWDASQQLAVAIIQEQAHAHRHDQPLDWDSRLLDALAQVLDDTALDPAMVALLLQLPSEAYLHEISDEIDVDGVHWARKRLKEDLAVGLNDRLWTVYQRHRSDAPYAATAAQIGQRSLKNTALQLLVAVGNDRALDLAHDQFRAGDNMTDVLAAMTALVHSEAEHVRGLKQDVLNSFYTRWRHEPLVVNQWFMVQASNPLPGGLTRVKALLKHEAFDIKNPNKVRAVIGAFCQHNWVNFHAADGSGYDFLGAELRRLDALNPQIAARLVTPLSRWRKFDAQRRERMRGVLQGLYDEPGLSKDMQEVVGKSLAES